MKKVLLIAAVAVLAMASCKKDHTCTCGEGDDAVKYTINGSKGNAKALCGGEGIDITDEEGNAVEDSDCSLD